MADAHEEEILGKAYDSRLMKRLLTYLRPYTWHVVISLVAIVVRGHRDAGVNLGRLAGRHPSSTWRRKCCKCGMRMSAAISSRQPKGLVLEISPTVAA